MTALGGFYKTKKEDRVYPKAAVVTINELVGEGRWQEVEDSLERSSFMSASVPVYWIKKLCG